MTGLGLGRTRREHDYDAWPVVADVFIGILGVIVLLMVDYKPPNPAHAAQLAQLRQHLQQDERKGLLAMSNVNETDIRLVYSADSLSFAPCDWKLPSDRAERVRQHVLLVARGVSRIDRVQIEGHADSRSAAACTGLAPYRDNLQLSQNRARAVFDALLGISTSSKSSLEQLLRASAVDSMDNVAQTDLRFLPGLAQGGRLQVAGYGSMQPWNAADPNAPLNRRVEVRIHLGARP
jgi:flagellar motor protein MotB